MSRSVPIEAAAIVVFALTYLAMALGGIPGLRLDRAGAALAGAAAMVACGALSLEEAYRAIDLGTLTLLLGMMIVVANLRLSGVFEAVSAWTAARARYPLFLLAAVVMVSGFFSAFLVNDTVCLVLTPLVCELTARLEREPVPYLLAVAMASNVGSVATITGNPQNIIIGSLSGIPYIRFSAALAPVAGVGLLLTIGLLALIFRREFWSLNALRAATQPPATDGARTPHERASRALAAKPILVTLAMMAAFFAGLPPPEVAIAAGALMLITRRIESRRIYAEIDWPLLAMFAGLFIVVAGLEKWVVSARAEAVIGAMRLDSVQPPVSVGVAERLVRHELSEVPAPEGPTLKQL